MSLVKKLVWSATSIALLLVVTGCAAKQTSKAATSAKGHLASNTQPVHEMPATSRPVLVSQSGSYFRWSMPEGWKADESSNGVDISSPDGAIIANSAVLMGSQGSTDPWSFLKWALDAAGYSKLKRISARNLPPQPSGYPGHPYVVKTFQITFQDENGQPRRAEVTIGICNAYGSFCAAFQGFSTPPDQFEELKTWLPLLPDSVQPIDASRVGNQNTVLLPRNHPLDDSSIMSSWQARRDSMDRIDQNQHETTMGYERMASPVDGQVYNMPFEKYDPSVGGYRDPADRNGVLKHAPPGQ